MHRRLILVAVVAIVAATTLSVGAPAVEAAGAKVAICHTPGHADDFITSGGGGFCVNTLGGNVIIVSPKACANGHGLPHAFRGLDSCDADNVGLLRAECLKGNPGEC